MSMTSAVVILIVSVVPAIFIVNYLQRLLMRVLDADMMFFSLKGKVIAYIVVASLIGWAIAEIFNISY